MKKLQTHIWLILVSVALFGCDKVELPIPEPTGVVVKGSIYPAVDSTNLNRSYKKTYVEEFTGHKCITCPANTSLLLAQQKESPERVIVVAYHAGGFAKVDMPKYPTDFTTDYGTEYHDFNGMSTQPIPSAIINRRPFEEYQGLKIFNNATTFWEGPINKENENTSADFALGVEADYSDSLEVLLIQNSAQALTDVTGNYRLLTLCVEDSIVAEQLDALADPDVYPGRIVTDYVHRHVLRANLSSDISLSGDKFIVDGLAKDAWADQQLSVEVPENVVDIHHLFIVSLLIDEATGEVVQSEETHVHVDN